MLVSSIWSIFAFTSLTVYCKASSSQQNKGTGKLERAYSLNPSDTLGTRGLSLLVSVVHRECLCRVVPL
jgi:hypothetical protein